MRTKSNIVNIIKFMFINVSIQLTNYSLQTSQVIRQTNLESPEKSKFNATFSFVIKAFIFTNLNDSIQQVSRESHTPYHNTGCDNDLANGKGLQ